MQANETEPSILRYERAAKHKGSSTSPMCDVCEARRAPATGALDNYSTQEHHHWRGHLLRELAVCHRLPSGGGGGIPLGGRLLMPALLQISWSSISEIMPHPAARQGCAALAAFSEAE